MPEKKVCIKSVAKKAGIVAKRGLSQTEDAKLKHNQKVHPEETKNTKCCLYGPMSTENKNLQRNWPKAGMDGTMVQENRERVNLKMGKMFKTVQWYDTGVKVQPFPLSFKSTLWG